MGTESGHSGTTENSFSIGDSGDGYKYIYANNSDVAQPGLRWNDDANQWEISDDGINWEKIRYTPAPIDAQYVVLAANGDLTNERVLEAAAGELALVDGGAGASVTLGLAPTGVVAGYYVSTDLTVDGYGRITDASDGYGGVYDGYGDVKYDVDYSPPPAPGGIIVSKLLPEGNYLLQAWAWIYTSVGEGDGIYIWLAKNGVQIDDTLDFCASFINYYWFRQIMIFSEYGEDVFSINAYQVGTGTAHASYVSLAVTRITPPGPPYAVGVFIDLPAPATEYFATDTIDISGTFYTPSRIDTLRVLYNGSWHFVNIVDDTWSISLPAFFGADTIDVEALYLDSRTATDSVSIVVQEIVGFPESLFNDYYGLYMDLNVPEDITYNTQPTGVDLDMELNNTTYWTNLYPAFCTLTKDTGSKHSGLRSLKLSNGDVQPSPSLGAAYQSMMIIGNNYIIDGYWRGDGTTGRPYFSDGTSEGTRIIFDDVLAEDVTWRSWLLERTPVSTNLLIGCTNDTGVVCSAYHDDISLRNLSINSVECKGNMGNLTQATAVSMPWLSDDECVTSFNINGNPALWHGLTPSYQYDYLASDQAAASWTLHKTTGFSVGFNFGGLESSLIDGGILFSTCNSFIDANIGVSVAAYGDQLYVAINNGADKTYDGYHGIILEDENVVVITMDETSLTVKLNSSELSIQTPLSVFSASDPTHTLRVGGRDLQGWIKDFLIFNGKITDGERDDLFDLLRSQLDFHNPLMFGDLFCWYKAQDIDALIVKATQPNLLDSTTPFSSVDDWDAGNSALIYGTGYFGPLYRSAVAVYPDFVNNPYAYQDVLIVGNKYIYTGGVASDTTDNASVYIGTNKVGDNDAGGVWRDITGTFTADNTRFKLQSDINGTVYSYFSSMTLVNLSRTRINNKGGSYDGYFYSDTPAEQSWFESDSIRFDSTDTLAASTDPADFTFLHDGYSTFVMKFKCNSITGNKYLFDTGNAGGFDAGFQIIRNSANLNVVIKDGISVVGGITAGTLVSGTTYVLVVRIDATDTISYLNGVTDTEAHTDALSTDPPYQCIIGGTVGGGITDDFDLIDLIMYERPITDNELNLLLTNYFEI